MPTITYGAAAVVHMLHDLGYDVNLRHMIGLVWNIMTDSWVWYDDGAAQGYMRARAISEPDGTVISGGKATGRLGPNPLTRAALVAEAWRYYAYELPYMQRCSVVPEMYDRAMQFSTSYCVIMAASHAVK